MQCVSTRREGAWRAYSGEEGGGMFLLRKTGSPHPRPLSQGEGGVTCLLRWRRWWDVFCFRKTGESHAMRLYPGRGRDGLTQVRKVVVCFCCAKQADACNASLLPGEAAKFPASPDRAGIPAVQRRDKGKGRNCDG